MTSLHAPAPELAARFERLARTELSRGARIAHVLLALVASALTIVVASLWLTEPSLPLRTSIAFALMTAIGLSWVVYSVWVLSARRVMFARQRVVAGRVAVTFCGVFSVGCVTLAAATDARGAWPAFAMSLALLAIALGLWRRAESAHASLLARRDALERTLAGGAR